MGHRSEPIRLRKGLYVSRDLIGGQHSDYNFRQLGDIIEALGGVDLTTEKSWAWRSKDAGTGFNYVGGFYELFSGNSDFNGGTTFGSANNPYAAHFMIVLSDVPAATTVIRVAGTSITDAGVRTASDFEDFTILSTVQGEGDYYETSKKWIGQVTITHQSGPLLPCNYGFCKYWDNNNADFEIVGFEATWLAGATDAGVDIALIHHRPANWAYVGAGEPTPPTPVATMAGDHGAESDLTSGQQGAWKRDNFSDVVSGSINEGTIIRVTTTAAKAFLFGNFMMRIRSG